MGRKNAPEKKKDRKEKRTSLAGETSAFGDKSVRRKPKEKK